MSRAQMETLIMTTRKPGRPYADTLLAKFVTRRVLELKYRKTQARIAADAGFTNANIMSMIKNGSSKLALDRVPALAKALECDAALLFRMALDQHDSPTTETAIRQIFRAVVTENEAAWLDELRDASDNSDPALTTRARAAIRGIFGK
ncbi:XRE family transcriptional regulator [Zhengella sp. ZM62]|uniref:XRE family transcriptional regulator n=1 Tax=Zhengella sedimenti TaxID=3390035 RepID=UPI003976F7C4